MLQYKSAIIRGSTSPTMLEKMLSGYNTLKYVPAALRGTASVDAIKELMTEALTLYAKYKSIEKECIIAAAKRTVCERNRQQISNMLAACGEDINDPVVQQQIDNLYFDRYGA